MSRLHRARRAARYAYLGNLITAPVIPVVTFAQSGSTDYYFASQGMRFPNKGGGGLGAGYSFYASQLQFRSAPWIIPAGTNLLVALPNHKNIEGNGSINEELLPADVQVEAVSVSYVDAGGTTRVAAATAFSNGGVLSSTIRNGGVIATVPLTYAIPAGALVTYKIALAGADNLVLQGFYVPRSSGETQKKNSTSFATAVNAGSSITTSGSATASILSTAYGPAFVCAKGADGRIVPLIDGDSLAYGKGANLLDDIIPDRVQGVVETALARTTNGWNTAWANFSIAGSGFAKTDMTAPNANNSNTYDANLQQGRHALVAQIMAMNGGKAPFTDIISEHGTNSIQTSAVLQKYLISSRVDWLRSMYPGKPVTQLTMTQNASGSSDGFRTLGGQSISLINSIASTRFQYNDDLLATKLDGKMQYAVNTYGAVAYDQGANRDHWAVHPYSATLTRVTTSAQELYVNSATGIGIGSSVVIDPAGGNPQLFVVRSIAEIAAGSEYRLGLDIGANNADMPVGKAIGASITGAYSADGDTDGSPGQGALHRSYEADLLTAAWSGANSWDEWKAAAKAAVGGAWANGAPPVIPVLGALTLSSTSAVTGTTWSATISGKTVGSTLAATSSDGTALTVTGATVSGAFSAAGTPTITVVETLFGATGSPRTSTATLTVSASTGALNALTASPNTATAGAVWSGLISGKSASSSIAVTSSDGTTVTRSGSNLSATFPTTGTVTLTFVETLAGAPNSPNTSTMTITVAAAPVLAALTMSPASATANATFTGAISGKTAGSTITATSSDGATLTVTGSTLTGTFATSGTKTITLVETLAGATGSPRTGTVSVTVAAASGSYDTSSSTLFAALTTQPTTARKTAIDNFIKRLKATTDGSTIWSKIDVMHMLAGADEQSALIDWKDPTAPPPR